MFYSTGPWPLPSTLFPRNCLSKPEYASLLHSHFPVHYRYVMFYSTGPWNFPSTLSPGNSCASGYCKEYGTTCCTKAKTIPGHSNLYNLNVDTHGLNLLKDSYN